MFVLESALRPNHTHSYRGLIFTLCVASLVGAIPVEAAELTNSTSSGWTRFRGANSTGVNTECKVPIPWQPEDVAWSIELPGIGNSSPVVFGGRVFIMSADPKTAERYLLAYDLISGNEVWKKSIESEPYHLHSRSSFASCTPCANEESVFFTWAAPGGVVVQCLSHDGEMKWTYRSPDAYVSQHGYGASPVLFGDKLIVFNSQQAEQLPPGAKPGQSRVTAFDASSGEIIWETPRTTRRVCYGLPSLFQDENGNAALLFANTGDGLFALSLDTGKPLWNNEVFAKRSVSCPQVVGELAIGTEGSGGGGNILYAVGLHGDHQVKFRINQAAPYVPTPVAKGDLLFLWDDKGIVTCVQLPSGDVIWKKRIGGNVSTSPVIAGDKLVGIAEDGTVTVLSASKTFKNLGSIKLEDTTRATPLVSENYLLVRSNSRLTCVGNPN